MKLHFEDNLDYQKAVINSVVHLFKGKEISRSEFTVTFQSLSNHNGSPNFSLSMEESELGIGNRLLLADEEIEENLRKIQLTNCLRSSEKLASDDFTVKMGTGTDNLKLINDCAEAIHACPPITKTRAQFRKADIAIGKCGVTAGETSASGFMTMISNCLPEIITDLQDKTQLTRKLP